MRTWIYAITERNSQTISTLTGRYGAGTSSVVPHSATFRTVSGDPGTRARPWAFRRSALFPTGQQGYPRGMGRRVRCRDGRFGHTARRPALSASSATWEQITSTFISKGKLQAGQPGAKLISLSRIRQPGVAAATMMRCGPDMFSQQKRIHWDSYIPQRNNINIYGREVASMLQSTINHQQSHPDNA